MLMADDSSNFWARGDFELGGDDVDLTIDLDTLISILGETTDPLQSSPGDLSLNNVSQGESAPNTGNHENSQLQGFQGAELMGPPTFYPPYYSEASDSKTGCSGGSFESAGNSVLDSDFGKLEHAAQIDSPVQTCSGSLKDGILLVPGHESCGTERVGVSQFEIPSCSTASSFAVQDGNHFSYHYRDKLDLDLLEGENKIQFGHVEGDILSKFADVYSPGMGNLDVNFGDLGALSENSMETLGPPENNSCTSMEMMDADISSHNATSNESPICQDSNVMSEFSDHYSAMQYCTRTDDTLSADPSWHCWPNSFNPQFFLSNEEMVTSIKDETEDFPTESAGSSCKLILDAQGGKIGRSVSEVSMIDHPDVYGGNFKCEGSNYISPIGGNCSSDGYDRPIEDKASSQSFTCTQSYMSSRKQALCVKDERNGELVAPRSTTCGSVEVNEAVSRKSSYSADDKFYIDKDLKPSLPGTSHSMSSQHVVDAKDEKEDVIFASKRARHSQDFFGGLASRSPNDGGELVLNASERHLPCAQPSALRTKQFGHIKDEREGKVIQPKNIGYHLSKVSPESIQSNSSECKSHVVDDDSDLYILEDISQPAPSNRSLALGKSLVPSQHSPFGDSLHYTGVGGTKLRANDERLIFRVALQDLSQPKSESSPPDGVLAVPLLRHQRIALSWMVQKETASLHCSGGILADDQGLGKTISTIALILKERAPTFRTCQEDVKQELETLNLDEDDDRVPGLGVMKQTANSCQLTSNGRPVKNVNTLVQAKGRPAAGTLVVCPTSVLRQWAEELHNKVTSKANLSVLVYHGSNRTKDPCELAKYDVVITTYSIVSMEVPKQPLVDKDDEEKGKPEAHVPPTENSFSRRRKYPPSSSKRCLKDKKRMDSELLESVSRPLARVGWFRVVLDEAQSIKNHRTQVARACWGLRAKRRWCLSGTPIQNAVDDLYSYFRFLRYDPYAVYTSFCSTIKAPINRNPSKGYRKLQAVLKTIMLRRTKGTLLDGEPIINLPPKSVELKKVDFSKEERDFYSRLEADSRAQFQEYAAAGTVKQNYVNILLMLLRLRQACDHPLLVKGYDSNSLWRSSVETAKKLPREEQLCLLNCLEASLAICGICNDPPEDAVVSICGHVFCKQCICEHLAGDDNQCPTTNCKVRFSVSSVFSKTTLNSSLSDQPGQDSSSDYSGSELVESVEPCYEDCSYDSSKIRTAIEVLQLLSKPRDSTSSKSSFINSFEGTSSCPGNSSDHHAGESLENAPDKRLSAEDEKLNDSIKVVGEKAIVFSQWTRMLDLLEARLKSSSIQYRRLDGTMSVVARDKAVKDFNTLPEVSVMIMSLKAASLGLNMVAACHVLLLDLWWNPTTEDQAIDRAHRIGQTRPVTVLRLTVKDTVEDRILALQQKKREMVASAFGEDETGGRQTRLTVEDLTYLFMV